MVSVKPLLKVNVLMAVSHTFRVAPMCGLKPTLLRFDQRVSSLQLAMLCSAHMNFLVSLHAVMVLL